MGSATDLSPVTHSERDAARFEVFIGRELAEVIAPVPPLIASAASLRPIL